jgi:hypothetical protein
VKNENPAPRTSLVIGTRIFNAAAELANYRLAIPASRCTHP